MLVVGSGVAGPSAAVRLAQLGRRPGRRAHQRRARAVDDALGAGRCRGRASRRRGLDRPAPRRHARAGAGLCDQAAVRVLVDEGSGRVHELIALGAVFDRVPAASSPAPARAVTRWPGSCTPAAPPPAPRSSGRS